MAKVTGTSLQFYATQGDMRSVLDYIFTSADLRMFKLSSEPGRKLREFKTIEDFDSVCPMSTTRPGMPQVNFLLWATSALGPKVKTRRINFNPDVCRGATFCYELESSGLITFYVGGVNANSKTLIRTNIGHQSETRAENWNSANKKLGVDWKALKTAANKIVYHIRKRLAAKVAQGCPLLPEALELVKRGYEIPGMLPPTMAELRKGNESAGLLQQTSG